MREIAEEYAISMSENTNLLCKIFDARGNGGGKISCTLTGNHQSSISDYTAIVVQEVDYGQGFRKPSPRQPDENQGRWDFSDDGNEGGMEYEPHTLMVMEGEEMETIVRRLTPLECERLQGYPDHWTDIGEWVDSKGKKHKDSDAPRYKALGNSIAVGYANNQTGFWCWLAEKMVNQLKEDGVENPTMGSLFDGIGGFPLAFSTYGCEPVWASEIEEFCIAVTKRRFPDEGDS